MSTLSDQPNAPAFAVLFKNLRVWSVGSFQRIRWQWSEEHVQPLATALVRRSDKVNRKERELDELQLITIHFDGTIEARNKPRTFKGRLFFAKPGDVVYSKIDVRNGAIGVVPEDITNAVVSSEFPVYQVRQDIALARYIKLLFQTRYFRQAITGLISGTSGRKRVQPEQLADLKVPLPPLREQHAIVQNFEQLQAEIDRTLSFVGEIQRSIHERFVRDLGIKAVMPNKGPKVFAVHWNDIARWSVTATSALRQVSLIGEKYPVVLGKDCLLDVKHGCSCSPSPVPTTLEVLKISAVTRGQFLPMERKYVPDSPRLRREFDLRRGDVLMCRTNGTLQYVGMSALVTENMKDLIFPDKIIRVRVRDNILPEFLWYLLQSSPLRAQLEAAARTAVGNYAIGSDDIWNLEMPLPTIHEQEEIVGRVKKGQTEIKRAEDLIRELSARSEKEVEEAILGVRFAHS
jgi:type I restriction enzyme S subunit